MTCRRSDGDGGVDGRRWWLVGHNPSVFGDNVTFSATVSSGAGTPTGSVVFTIDGTAVPPVALVGGVATTCDVGVVVSGPHTVHAEYTSDTGDWADSSGYAVDGQSVTAAFDARRWWLVGHEPVGVR